MHASPQHAPSQPGHVAARAGCVRCCCHSAVRASVSRHEHKAKRKAVQTSTRLLQQQPLLHQRLRNTGGDQVVHAAVYLQAASGVSSRRRLSPAQYLPRLPAAAAGRGAHSGLSHPQFAQQSAREMSRIFSFVEVAWGTCSLPRSCCKLCTRRQQLSLLPWSLDHVQVTCAPAAAACPLSRCTRGGLLLLPTRRQKRL